MNKNRDEIVNKAFFQFLNRGYNACSLKELEKATGLTKGAFYYYFRNKAEILKEGLERYASVIEVFEISVSDGSTPLREYIKQVLQEKENRAEKLQTLFGTFIVEEFFFQLALEVEPLFPEYRKKLDALVRKRFTRWKETIARAKHSGEIRKEPDTSVLARNLMSVPMSMVNIELVRKDLKYAFSDMRLQFEQYYMLIKT